MTSSKFHVQSCGLFWFLSTVYLVHVAFNGAKRPTETVFNLVVRRPRIAGGTVTIPIDSSVRLVKCSRYEAPHNTIRLRYGKTRKCLVMRASDSLEREKWLVGLIQAMAAAQSLGEHMPTSTVLHNSPENTVSATSYSNDTPSSVDTVSSSVDRLDNNLIPVLPLPLSGASRSGTPIDILDQNNLSISQGSYYFHRRCAQETNPLQCRPSPPPVRGLLPDN